MRTRTAGRAWPALALALALVAAAGCRGGVTPIRTLLDEPERYGGTVVRIAGRVGFAAGILGYGAYQVDDGTGTIFVVSRGTGTPGEGDGVVVEGTYRSVYTLGPRTVAVVIERRRAPRRGLARPDGGSPGLEGP